MKRLAPFATWHKITCLQLLCNLAMEPPPNVETERVRDEKVKVLRSVQHAPSGRRGARAV